MLINTSLSYDSCANSHMEKTFVSLSFINSLTVTATPSKKILILFQVLGSKFYIEKKQSFLIKLMYSR